MARTLVTDDPLFGWFAYGGELSEGERALSVVPRDGLCKRFDVVRRDPRVPWLRAERLGIELDRDGFAHGRPVGLEKDLSTISFTLENRTGDPHAHGALGSRPVQAHC